MVNKHKMCKMYTQKKELQPHWGEYITQIIRGSHILEISFTFFSIHFLVFGGKDVKSGFARDSVFGEYLEN